MYLTYFSGLGEIEHFLNKQENCHNPFLENSSPRMSFLDVAVDILTTITSRRNSRKYTLFWEVIILAPKLGHSKSGLGLPKIIFCLCSTQFHLLETLVASRL